MDLQYTVALNLNYILICNGMITSFLIHPRFKLGGIRDFVSQVSVARMQLSRERVPIICATFDRCNVNR